MASEGRIATGKRFTLQMILTTAGNAAKSAVQVRFAKGENARRWASEKRIAMENGLIL